MTEKYFNDKGFSPILMVLLVGFVFASSMALTKIMNDNSNPSATAGSGNDAASKPYYNLELIAVTDIKTVDMNSEAKLYIPSTGSCTISLDESVSDNLFVTDPDCNDGKSSLQLPNTNSNKDGTTNYYIYVKAAKKLPIYTPVNGRGSSCLNKEGEMYCTFYNALSVNEAQASISDISEELLNVSADLTGPQNKSDGIAEQYSLFDAALEDYLWTYDNNQTAKIAEIRFYRVP